MHPNGFNIMKNGITVRPGFWQLLVAMVLVSGCLSPSDFRAENKGGRIVVSGQVSNLEGRSYVQLGETSKDNRLPLPITGALVQLLDDVGGVESFVEDIQNPGNYRLSSGAGIAGRTYHLEIMLVDGKVYETEPETIPLVVGTLATHFSINNEEYTDGEGTTSLQPFVKVYANATLPPADAPMYLRWTVEEVFLLSPTDFPDPFGSIPPPCFVNQNADPQRVVLYNGFEFPTNEIKDELVCSRLVDYSFLERHYFTTYQSSLTASAHEYLRKVNILANQVGSIFDTPPAEIKGNARRSNNPAEQTLGYFRATHETIDRFFILPGDFPVPLTIEPCTFDGSFNPRDYPSRCIDCLTVRNSSYNRPNWF